MDLRGSRAGLCCVGGLAVFRRLTRTCSAPVKLPSSYLRAGTLLLVQIESCMCGDQKTLHAFWLRTRGKIDVQAQVIRSEVGYLVLCCASFLRKASATSPAPDCSSSKIAVVKLYACHELESILASYQF